MKSYRVYGFDGAGRIIKAELIEASNDAEAVVTARELMDYARVEVWELDRLAGRYERPEAKRPNVRSPPIPGG